MQEVKSVRDADVKGKRVLIRVDFNVPLDMTRGEPHIADDSRIRATLPTIELLQEHKVAQIILIAHLGRPGGKVVESLRLAPVEKRFRELTGNAPNVSFLENVRFDPREEANDEMFAKELAQHGDIFVNEAFADSHRAHASIVGIPKFLPSYAGLHLLEEIEKLSHALAPQKPALAIVGGDKLETKLTLIEKLSPLYDKVFVGGALANAMAESRGNIIVPADGVPQKKGMFDIGPATSETWAHEIKNAKFVLWNGPVGWYEKGYNKATDVLAQALVDSGVEAVIGGGDTAAALAKFSFDPRKVFISTGGGAMLQFLVEGTLPGIEALKNSKL
jgi:3-phosphoglycerate kinase